MTITTMEVEVTIMEVEVMEEETLPESRAFVATK